MFNTLTNWLQSWFYTVKTPPKVEVADNGGDPPPDYQITYALKDWLRPIAWKAMLDKQADDDRYRVNAEFHPGTNELTINLWRMNDKP